MQHLFVFNFVYKISEYKETETKIDMLFYYYYFA